MEISSEEINNGGDVILKLGDIIQIVAPQNPDIHDNSFFIDYIDDTKITIQNIASLEKTVLEFTNDGAFQDESIREILLQSRSEQEGYARQNDYLQKTWIDIYFGGEVPSIITGEITNLEEDMIEITTFPGFDIIYIDFEYKGLPENLPIDKIVKREPPASAKFIDTNNGLNSDDLCPVEKDSSFSDELYDINNLETADEAEPNIRDVLQAIYLDAKDIFGDDLEEITQLVEISESKKRYGIETQINDFTDEILSTIPNHKRTSHVLQKIQNLIQRFRELRNEFSVFDSNGAVSDIRLQGSLNKPIIEKIANFNHKIRWFLPIVSQQKKIYLDNPDTFTGEDAKPLKIIDEIVSQNRAFNEYKNNQMQGVESNYDQIYRVLGEYSTPFLNPESNQILDQTMLTSKQKIGANIDSIVGSLNDIYSTVVKKGETQRQQYVIQRYNLGLTKTNSNELKSGKKVNILGKLTPDDEISVKSFMLLPEPVFKFSAVDLPGTSIINRTELAQFGLYYFRLFKKSKNISRIVEQLDQEIDYDSEKNPFFGLNIEYLLDENIKEEYAENQSDRSLKRFLNVVLPKTRKVIEMLKDNPTDNLSFKSFVSVLEPFFIYTDNITYTQYNSIRFFLKEKIKNYKVKYVEKKNDFGLLRNYDFRVNSGLNSIEELLFMQKNVHDIFKESYRILTNDKSTESHKDNSSTILEKILSCDYGRLYSALISYMVMLLIAPNKLLSIDDGPTIEDLDAGEKKIAQDCTKHFLAKRYNSMAELQKDNHRDDIFYDKDLDDTPYDILKKYQDQQKKRTPDDFLDFLAENLIEKHDCPPSLAKTLAETLVLKKKLVKDGEYAILEIRPVLTGNETEKTNKDTDEYNESEAEIRKKTLYYRRLKNVWVQDKDIFSESFLETSALFCNSYFKCNKNEKLDTCESNDISQIRMRHMALTNRSKEFDRRFSITVEEWKTELEAFIETQRALIKRQRIIKEIHKEKHNNYAYQLGKLISDEEIVVSPYANLRDLILGQPDFIKKQKDICDFVNNLCREPADEHSQEDMNWFYCRKTNIRLFPFSLYNLAKTFVSGGNYRLKLAELCSSIGTLSEDGDAIVDRYSGYELQKIDFNEEEGFDNSGFKIITHGEIEEQDKIDILGFSNTTNKIRVFEDETSQMIYRIFSALSTNIGISINNQPNLFDDMIVRLSLDLINNKTIVQQEKSYLIAMEKMEKQKGKSLMPPYEIYKNQTIIVIVSSVLLSAIQTAVPSFKPKKTFPGCTFSFSGYPLDGGIENMSSINYFACVLAKMKASIVPWNSLEKLNEKRIADSMQKILEKYILINTEIASKYAEKREFLLLNPEIIETENDINHKWLLFQPPVVKFTVSHSLQPITADAKTELLELMRKGSNNNNQRKMIAMFRSKIIIFSYNIIQSVYSIVREKSLLLKTVSKIPFLDNACCNEKSTTNTISYFIDEDKSIEDAISVCKNIQVNLKYVGELSKAPILYHPKFTGVRNSLILPNAYTEETLYLAFIHYCHFDSELPIPEELQSICSEKIPGYNSLWPLQEKIEFLKKNGKRFTIDNLNHLMTLIHRKNLVFSFVETDHDQIRVIQNFLSSMENLNSKIIEEPLRRLLNNVFSASSDSNDYTKIEVSLKNYLIKSNSQMLDKIINFIDNYGNLSSTEYNKINQFLSNIGKWTLTEDNEIITNFIKNMIYSVTKANPNIIINNITYSRIPVHWKLANSHYFLIQKIVQNYSSAFDKFKGNSVLRHFLMEFVKQVEDVYAFSKLIPQTGIDNETILLLHIYGIYSCFYDFIDLTNSPEILKLDIREKKVKRKNKIKENIDEALLINSVHFEKGNAEDDEYEETLKEIEFDTGDEGEFKTQCCSLLLVFIEQGKNDKKIIDKTYADIMKRVSKSKKEEKDSITSYLENMEVDERKIEDLLKKYKLERWNAGQQSGLIKYDRQLYESQHEVNEIRLFDDLKDKEVDTNQLYRNILNNISAPVSDINDLNDYDMAADADPNIAYDRELPINDYYDGYDNGDGDGDYNDGDDNDMD